MAIIKEVKLPSHVVATYHKIVKWEFSASDRTMTIVVAQFLSKEDRDGGAQPIYHEYVRIPESAFAQSPLQLGYQCLGIVDSPFTGGAADL